MHNTAQGYLFALPAAAARKWEVMCCTAACPMRAAGTPITSRLSEVQVSSQLYGLLCANPRIIPPGLACGTLLQPTPPPHPQRTATATAHAPSASARQPTAPSQAGAAFSSMRMHACLHACIVHSEADVHPCAAGAVRIPGLRAVLPREGMVAAAAGTVYNWGMDRQGGPEPARMRPCPVHTLFRVERAECVEPCTHALMHHGAVGCTCH